MSIKTLGVDLSKLSCHIIGQDQHGKVVEKRKVVFTYPNHANGMNRPR